ncbi:protein ZGRF1-like [Dendronephthya gigantea]|uniref:protein ZGRF1-like n=1 Tax=Dendronephthya gigantea TaxID=151771 RepID=UPI001069EF36|nr:protein ZGRF1-like [Dendronephthya gigantea]
MSTRNFEVLYTHQKLKKAKTWQDGCLKVSCRGTKAVLYDDQDCSLEVFHIHPNKIFPGSDVECERYLISIVDEKIADDKGSNCGTASQDISSKRHLAYLPSARTDHSGSTWRKRKRDFRETLRPNLPSPDQDYELPENLKPRSPLCFKRPSTNDDYGLSKPSTISRLLPAKSDNLHLTSTVLDENDAARMSLLVRTSRGETSFHQQRNETSCFPQRNFQETMSVFAQDIDLENTPGDFEVLAAQVNVDEEDLILQKSNQVTMQNPFPAPKRNKSELLSLFGGAKNMVIARGEKPGLRSIEGDEFPPESYSTVTKCKSASDESISPSTKSLFYQSFDMSLGDEDDFFDNSFQSLYNPKSESFIPGATSKPTSLFPQSNASTGNDSICVKNYNFDLDDGQAVFSRNFDRNSSPRTSDLENKNRGLRKPETIKSGLCSTGGYTSSPSSAFDEWCVQNNNDIMDLQNHDLGNDTALSDDFDDAEISLFDGFSEGPQSSLFPSNNMRFRKQCFGSEKFDRSNADDHSDQSSLRENAFEKEINNISVQNHSLSRVSRKYNHFTPPLISLSSGDKKHVSSISTYQTDLKAPSFDRAVPEPNSRQQSFSGELHFPSNIESSDSVTPTRQITITTKFSSAMDYKCVLKSALREHLNIILFGLAQKYHGILGKADIASSDDTVSDEKENVKGPSCSHGPGKLRAVKKDGPNKGRHFYTCPASGSNQCKFFLWADENHATSTNGNKKISLTSSDSIRTFFKSKGIYFYHNCILERRSKPTKYYGKKYSRKAAVVNEKKAMYITLKYRDSSSLYTKDDLWIISKNVNFDPKATFVAKSSFYGPSSNGDLEIEPVSGYSTSNWRSGDTVHAIWACNAGTELSCIQNLDEHVSLQQMPLLPYILNGSHPSFNSRRSGPGFFSAPLSGRVDRNSLGIPWPVIEQEVNEIIALYKLNPDQSTAIRSCAKMFVSENDNGGKECLPITLIHGVFGAGKSFLLAVVVLLMVKLFEMADASG